MSLKKSLFIILSLLIMANAFSDSLRNYVCIVKGNLSEKNITYLQDYSNELKQSGYDNFANYIESFLEGSFGSGFIYYASNGTPFIITNQHVVADYETVSVIFENEDGSSSEFKDLQILATDINTDIAIISLPENFKRKGLQLKLESISDGDDVWSAGFPGLNDEPIWQLGKGIVSNSKAKVKDLLDPSFSTLIQHTAEIDGGNSGGPLLVKNSNANSGYSVIGINTWKAIYRQNTNYSIPAKMVYDFVEKTVSGIATIDIEERVNSFVSVLENDDSFYDITKYISNKMVSEMGSDAFEKVLERAPENVRSYIVEAFAFNPFEGLRCSIASLIWSKFRNKDEFEMPKLGALSKNAEVYSLDFNPETDSSINSKWIKEWNQWKLLEFEGLVSFNKKSANKSDKKSKDGDSNVSFDMENVGTFTISIDYISSLSFGTSGFDLETAMNYDYFGIGGFVQKIKVPYTYEEESYEEDPTVFGMFLSVKVPMLIESFIVEPFTYLRLGFNFSNFFETNLSPLLFGFGAGINLGYETSFDVSPYVTIKYNYMPFKIKNDFEDTEKLTNHELSVGIGVKLF